ncbi:alpha-N-arabinofuranosidase [Sporanaerobium hydrogeniformans]|uniref:Alpha-N-arabinofuranosidase n=1 Tax=Sporanaerobium hydrogeniformans TaxID=3072179 RepID=A0AC61DBM0_9FIRM|nr:alpha-L-arabinofuranosidase C-terminal domain-containing protein [Sporanaerobium hydrogeniformans]PHV69922.1 alpha-N-arabinofuranosidase [Sporanaerobium hydrogeniformans]
MAKWYINPHIKKGHIHKELQGHFSEHLGRCIYEGLYVGEESPIPNKKGMRIDVVEALKNIQIPVLRWPGGCFADEYHWKDGIGPKETRKKMINTHWGGGVEDNSFGTHEFMELCEQLGCKTYISGNLGSGTVQEMSEWVEYMTFDGLSPMAALRTENGRKKPWRVDYFGIGNENWGCGGNMTPEYYGNEYRRYQTYVRSYQPDKTIFKIACGANGDDYAWTEGVMKTTYTNAQKQLHGFMDGLSLHYYTVPGTWEHKGSATLFDEKEWYTTLKKTLYMETLIKCHEEIMNQYDTEHKNAIIIDEWGTWYDPEPGTNPGFLYQQNTMRDALVAAINLNIFNKNCNRVRMANIAQVVNVLQAVILTEGKEMVLTPTYHVFDLYKYHQEAELIESHIETKEIGVGEEQVPNLTESVSLGQDGKLHLTLANLSIEETYPIEGLFTDTQILSAEGSILKGNMRDHNTFEEKEKVKLEPFTKIKIVDGQVHFEIPPCSVVHLALGID